MDFLYSIGKIFDIPKCPDHPYFGEYVISFEPSESIGKIGKIILHKLWDGEKENDWEVEYFSQYVSLLSRPMRLLHMVFYVDHKFAPQPMNQMPFQKIQELKNARYEAEKRSDYRDPLDPNF